MPMKTLIIHKNKQNTIEIYINNKLRFPTNMNNGTHNMDTYHKGVLTKPEPFDTSGVWAFYIYGIFVCLLILIAQQISKMVN
jgi:hypothetical protein